MTLLKKIAEIELHAAEVMDWEQISDEELWAWTKTTRLCTAVRELMSAQTVMLGLVHRNNYDAANGVYELSRTRAEAVLEGEECERE